LRFPQQNDHCALGREQATIDLVKAIYLRINFDTRFMQGSRQSDPKLGEFSTFGRLLTLGIFFKSAKVGQRFSQNRIDTFVHGTFDGIWVGLHFGLQKNHLATLESML
jgi:hypothetical protein